MGFFDKLNGILDSTPFKAAFPVQALGQGITQGVTGMAGINHGQGLSPVQQYGLGAAGGAGIAGGAALLGGGAGASGAGAGAASGGSMSPSLSLYGPGTGQTPLSASLAGSSGATGVGGASAAGSGGMGNAVKVLQAMRGMGGMGQQSQAPATSNLQQIYAQFPMLRPGSQFGGQHGA